ncbi:MAG: translation initiation factor IF-5A [Candidatus Aenigmatarchaeota archaeon]|nr:translation initiation factor IF-5A [Candidatus Aenigmarchaeota archaeon]MBU5688991.1 translation initiation factor IF-5A [Candidatus Aenigmarchaeota archaeon]
MAQVEIKDLKKGSFVTIDGVPCRVDEVSISKSGKHGHAKVRVDAIGLFDGIRKSIVKPSDARVDTPMILKKKAQVLAIIGNKAQLMNLEDYSTIELDIPEELQGKLKEGEETFFFEVDGVRTLKQIK